MPLGFSGQKSHQRKSVIIYVRRGDRIHILDAPCKWAGPTSERIPVNNPFLPKPCQRSSPGGGMCSLSCPCQGGRGRPDRKHRLGEDLKRNKARSGQRQRGCSCSSDPETYPATAWGLCSPEHLAGCLDLGLVREPTLCYLPAFKQLC